MACDFCENLALFKDLDRRDPEILKEYTVALVQRSWTKEKGKRNAGRLTDFRYRGIGYRLQYCPTCGKKVEA